MLDGRNANLTFASTSTSLTSYSDFQFNPDPFYGFNYPADNGGDDDRPGTAFLAPARRQQRHRAVLLRRRARAPAATARRPTTARRSRRPRAASSPAWRRSRSTPRRATTRTRTPTAHADPAREVGHPPAHALERDLAAAAAPGARRARRRRRRRRRPPTAAWRSPPRDTVTFGFGLEQVDQATREALVAARVRLPAAAAADTTAPVGDVHVPGRANASTADRPGRHRGQRLRRARRHQGGPPVRQRHAREGQAVVPVPVPLLPDGGAGRARRSR